MSLSSGTSSSSWDNSKEKLGVSRLMVSFEDSAASVDESMTIVASEPTVTSLLEIGAGRGAAKGVRVLLGVASWELTIV